MKHLGLLQHFLGDGTSIGHGSEFSTIYPGTGQELARVVASSAEDVNQAVELARQAGRAWAKRSGVERGRVLLRAAELLRQHNDELAYLETLDTGKPLAESSTVDIQSAADCLEYFGSCAALLQSEYLPQSGALAYTLREPIGVVGAIGAWNYPLQIAAWKAAPALAMGNAVIFKPSELTPVTALRLADLFLAAGLPPGLFQVVQGAGDVGAMLASHPGIGKVSLTGSVLTGKKVANLASQSLKKVSLELGGKSPLIIFDDCDLEQAIQGTLLANVFTQGEICSNGTRVFVQKQILSAFTERLLAKLRSLRLGDPLDPKTQIGALISATHQQRVLSYIETGIREGAELLCGGRPPAPHHLPSHNTTGYFVEPAVFAHCHDAMTIVREEIFGPVISLLGFEDEEEVIARANGTDFGLAAGIFTRDLTKAHRLVPQIEAGIVWVNNYNITPVQLPFGGTKHSGMGRENGLAALHDYSIIKSVYVELSGVSSPYS